jgi:hypothetical protein
MKNKTSTKSKKGADIQEYTELSNRKSQVVRRPGGSQVYTKLAEEGHEDFYSYLEWLGLAKKPDILILTSSRNYYFDVEDLKNIRVVVNINQLNKIKRLKDFLQAVFEVLPHKCHFIGCFRDLKNQNEHSSSVRALHQIDGQGYLSESDEGPWNSFLNMFYGIIDSKTNRYLNKKTVQFMLEDAGFKILDITEFNGLTYFCTKKDKPSVE